MGAQLYDIREDNSAKMAWDRVIAAKGGRDRLHSVNSFVVSSKGLSGTRVETLYALPSRYWSWLDERRRGGPFGLSVIMYDWARRKEYAVYGEGNFQGLHHISPNMPDTNMAGVTVELLETRWNRPQPVALHEKKIANQRLIVIETILRGERGDYVIDPKTNLPIEFIGYNKEGTIGNHVLFAEYATFDGIQMPTRVIFKGSDRNTEYMNTYRFNVDFDESIFSSPPAFEKGPEAWRRRS